MFSELSRLFGGEIEFTELQKLLVMIKPSQVSSFGEDGSERRSARSLEYVAVVDSQNCFSEVHRHDFRRDTIVADTQRSVATVSEFSSAGRAHRGLGG